MHKDNVQQFLLDYSADQETPYIPIILQGRFYKRISKEEIKGWSSGHPVQPFQTEKSPKRIKLDTKLQNISWGARNRHTSNSKEKIKLQRQLNSAKQLKNSETSGTNNLFKTFQHLPEIINSTINQKPQTPHQQQKIDFVKGKKMSYPKARSTLIVKPFFTTFSARNNTSNNKKHCRLTSREFQNDRSSIKSAPKQNTSGVFMISYPIDSSTPYKRSCQGEQSRFRNFIKKFKR